MMQKRLPEGSKSLKMRTYLLKNRAEFLEFFNESSSSWETFRDKDGRLFYLSPLFEEISGLQPE